MVTVFMFWFLYPVSPRRGGSSGASLWTARRVVAPHGQPPRLPRFFRGMAPTAARRARPVQRNGHQDLRGNPDACRPRRGSAWRDDHYGAPAEAQRSGFGGERRHSGGNELCRLRRSERSATCADEAGGNARLVSALCVQPTAAMGPPYWGGWGRRRRGRLRCKSMRSILFEKAESPPALLSPHFFGKKWGRPPRRRRRGRFR